MIEALLTLLAALTLAAVAGWFSIVGVMSIYAGAIMTAIVLGASIEFGKLVMISSLFRNWKIFPWILKGPMLGATLCIMLVTSMSVFGFLSKAHLEQGAATIDNGPRIERLNEQIAREKSRIADDEKVISQLDATVNSFIGKDNGDRALQVRRSQDSQRRQLRADINTAQKSIDELSNERAPLVSEVRKLQLDVGPIRYIGELIYGDNNTEKNIEFAVKLFSGLIVLILDPSAVMLLIAFNHTIMRLENEKKQKTETSNNDISDAKEKPSSFREISAKIYQKFRSNVSNVKFDHTSIGGNDNISEVASGSKENEVSIPILPEAVEVLKEESKVEHKKDYQPYLSANDIIWPEIKFYEKKEIPVSKNEEDISTRGEVGVSFNLHKLLSEEQGSTEQDTKVSQEEINEKKEIIHTDGERESGTLESINSAGHIGQHEEGSQVVAGEDSGTSKIGTALDDEIQSEGTLAENVEEDEIDEDEKAILEMFRMAKVVPSLPIIRSPTPTNADKPTESRRDVEGREEISTPLENAVSTIQVNDPPTITFPPTPHFIPQKARNYRIANPPRPHAHPLPSPPPKIQPIVSEPVKTDKYPKALSWLNEFERSEK